MSTIPSSDSPSFRLASRKDRFEGMTSRYGYGSGYATKKPEPPEMVPRRIAPVRMREPKYVPPPITLRQRVIALLPAVGLLCIIVSKAFF